MIRELDCLEASSNKSTWRAGNFSNFRNHNFESPLSNTEVGAARNSAFREHGTGLQSNESPTRLQGGSGYGQRHEFRSANHRTSHADNRLDARNSRAEPQSK